MQQAPNGVAGDVARDDAGASRERVEPFTAEREVAAAWPSLGPGVKAGVWFDGDELFNVAFRTANSSFGAWTTEEGLEAIIGACMAALVRARIAREQAS